MARTTIQRTLVLDAVSLLGTHPSPEEVYSFIIQKHPTVSKATVYRNLKMLANERLLLKVETPSGADCFDHNCHNHYHFQCMGCLKVFDVEIDYMYDIESRIKDRKGFEFIGHDIIFKGFCPACKSA